MLILFVLFNDLANQIFHNYGCMLPLLLFLLSGCLANHFAILFGPDMSKQPQSAPSNLCRIYDVWKRVVD